ncbi:MAG TPA: sigma-70 family RNA polymerase sigma factor [Chloroflexota bacterium]
MRPSDAQLLFDQLYADHRRPLHAFFLGRTSDRELALDLLQELFLRVWRSIQVVDALPAERRHHWLYSVARNLVVDTYRTRAAGAAAVARLQRLTPPDSVDPPETTALQSELVDRLDRAIHKLPDDLRIVLVLQVLGERTSAQIGELLGRPPGTVRYQLARVRRRLADELAGDTAT